MAVAAQSVIRRVVDTLQDPTAVRWPTGELVRYLNDGQREIVLYRPDAMVTDATVALEVGTRQSIPAAGAKLIEIVRNTGGDKRAVRLVNREILDAQVPGWHGMNGSTQILHYIYDPRDPKVFYVYPPAASGASLELVYSLLPTDVSVPADGELYSAVAGNISVPDIYANTLQDYILYRAYSKDSEYAGNAARATAHYAAFANALGIEIKATVAVGPNPVGNPNRAAAGAA